MFTNDSDFERVDWPLLQNGAVNVFWKPKILIDAVRTLAELNYEIAEVSCGAGVLSFEAQMSAAVRWREQFGYEPWTGNLDALEESISSFHFGPSGRGALVLSGFHHLVAIDSERARGLLDNIESAARDLMLRGNLLIALIQTDDASYSCEGIGCRDAHLNVREAIMASRGL